MGKGCLALHRRSPTHIIRILTDNDNWSSYCDLAVDILSVVLPNCSTEDASTFECLIKPLHASIVSRRDWKVDKLENSSSALLRISGGILDADDVEDVVEVVSKFLYDKTDQLPSAILLRVTNDLLKRLVDEPKEVGKKGFLGRAAPNTLRVVIGRLLHASCLPEEYQSLCFTLSALLVRLLDFHWFEPDPEFLVLLAALTHVQFRVVLGDPLMIRVEDLIPCATLGESFIQCVEEGEFLNDEQATAVSRSCRDCVAYVCEYVTECHRDKSIQLDASIEMVVYRFLCSFLAVGGHQIINRNLVDDILPILIDVARRACEGGDTSMAEMLLPSLSNFESLPNSCLGLIVMCMESQSSLESGAQFFTNVIPSLFEKFFSALKRAHRPKTSEIIHWQMISNSMA
ncbi:unnamed protein product [Toxocara canis]|uniref:Serine/threonine-protein kinase ATR n=1 Tax=Toxocara canis TaxID=6265 RepID=A0A183V1S1_TOXCA|nr:unnamed protein product [Toxocara canis]